MNTQDYIAQKESDSLYFWYRARKILIDQMLGQKFNSFREDREILDVGCGTGTELDILKKYGKVTAIDMDETALELIRKENCQAIKGDIENIPLAKDHFDCICCFDILEHLNDDKQVLANIYDALKPNGYIFITSPAYQMLYSTHDKYTGHVRRYSKKELWSKLKKSGFKDIELGYWNFFLFLPIALVRLTKKFVFIFLLRSTAHTTDAKPLNRWLNSILFQILNFENILIKRSIKFPFGLTIFGAGKK